MNRIGIIVLACLHVAAFSSSLSAQAEITQSSSKSSFWPFSSAKRVKSPDQKISVEFGIAKSGAGKGLPYYQVTKDGETLIAPSQLGIAFQHQAPLADMSIESSQHQSGDSTYTQPVGKKSFIHDVYEEYSFVVSEKSGSHRTLNLVFRIYNDGFGIRYGFPKQSAFSDFVITDELTNVTLAENPYIYGLPLGFSSSYEWYYRKLQLDHWAVWDNLALPMLLEYPSGKYVGITEANLTDYAGMYLEKSKTLPNTLETRLAPWLGQTEIKVKGSTPFVSPWRVFIIGDTMNTLVESTLIEDLNDPSAIQDTSWIHTGKVQFPWWNAYYVPKPDPNKAVGLNTWTLEHYTDFCARNGIEFHSIDGFDKAWYGGPVDPFQSTGVTEAIPEINLPEVLKYAKDKNVKTRLWMHWGGLSKDVDHALDTYEKWGVDGIMVDFLNRDDQEMVRSYHEILTKTAAHHLNVNFHGVFKPTGQGRTYPHLLNHEAVLGTEYNKWGEFGSTPEHEVNVAYVRMLAGPLDTHEGGFRPIPVKDYKFSWVLPPVMGTLSRSLAHYVVFENHLPMLADYPEIYEQYPQPFEFVKQVPVTWDETKMVSGVVGQYITIARRKGADWYLGTITDRDERSFDLPLSFLGEGNYIAEVYSDASDYALHPDDVAFERIPVTRNSKLSLILAPAGGNAVRIVKQNQ